MGVKALLLRQLGESFERQFEEEVEYTTNTLRGAKAAEAFSEFITRKGLKQP
jgi:hypothetical protein